MENTDNYIVRVKNSFFKRISAYFILYLIVFFILSLTSFLLFSAYRNETSFLISSSEHENIFSAIIHSICEEMSTTISLLLIFVSSFTIVNKAVSVLVCAWHGISVGCATALIKNGSIFMPKETYPVGIILDFLSVILIIFAASYSAVYSSCIVYSHSCEDYKTSSALCTEFFKLFLFISGLTYLVGLISNIFM